MKAYLKDLRYYLENKLYVLCILFTTLLGYGYAVTHITFDIDDIRGDLYFGSGNVMFSAGRFGMVFWNRIIGATADLPANAYAIDVMALVFLALAAVNFCILFRRITNDALPMISGIIFSCMLISYPLMNEIWEYTNGNLCVCGGYCFVSWSLLIMQVCLRRNGKKRWLIAAALLMMIVCSSYESLAVVYVFGVFVVLAMELLYAEEERMTFASLLKEGLAYAGLLLSGILLRVIVHRMILLVFRLEASTNGATKIEWGNAPFFETARELLVNITHRAAIKGFIYLPITELLLCVAVFGVLFLFLAWRRRRPLLLLPAAGMLVSLILLALLQGAASVYRTCQVYAVFVAFTCMLLSGILCNCEKRSLRRAGYVVSGLLLFLCVHQAVYLNRILTVNCLRSDEEAAVIRNIGYELQSYDLDKPVVFTGHYELSEYIQEAVSVSKSSPQWQLYCRLRSWAEGSELEDTLARDDLRKFTDSNIQSVISWAQGSGDLGACFGYYGYGGIDFLYEEKILEDAQGYAMENDMAAYPAAGYIVDVGDYLIVNLGNI